MNRVGTFSDGWWGQCCSEPPRSFRFCTELPRLAFHEHHVCGMKQHEGCHRRPLAGEPGHLSILAISANSPSTRFTLQIFPAAFARGRLPTPWQCSMLSPLQLLFRPRLAQHFEVSSSSASVSRLSVACCAGHTPSKPSLSIKRAASSGSTAFAAAAADADSNCVRFAEERCRAAGVSGHHKLDHPVHGPLFIKKSRSADRAAHEQRIYGMLGPLRLAGVVPELFGSFRVRTLHLSTLPDALALLYDSSKGTILHPKRMHGISRLICDSAPDRVPDSSTACQYTSSVTPACLAADRCVAMRVEPGPSTALWNSLWSTHLVSRFERFPAITT